MATHGIAIRRVEQECEIENEGLATEVSKFDDALPKAKRPNLRLLSYSAFSVADKLVRQLTDFSLIASRQTLEYSFVDRLGNQVDASISH